MCSPECASNHAESFPVECRILGRLEEERSDLANPRQADRLQDLLISLQVDHLLIKSFLI